MIMVPLLCGRVVCERGLRLLLQFRQPKGPFRTKNTTTIVKIVNYYAVVFLLCPPNLVRRGPFFERKNVCNSQENGVRTRCAAIVNHPAVLKILRVVNLIRVLFLVRRGPLGISEEKGLFPAFSSGHVRPRQGTEICNFGALRWTGFLALFLQY